MNMPLEQRIAHLKKSIEHCVSVIALCRVSGSTKAEASYEAHLAELNKELEWLIYQKMISELEQQSALGEIK